MNQSKLVSTEQNGIGVVISHNMTDGTYTVRFPDGAEKRLREVRFLNDDWHEFLSDGKRLSAFFRADTYKKAKEYYTGGHVKHTEFDFSRDVLCATVTGTRTYRSEIHIGKSRRVTMYCSCPVARNCKHCVAALIGVSSLLESPGLSSPAVSAPVVPETVFPGTLENAMDAVRTGNTPERVLDSIRSLLVLIDQSDYSSDVIVKMLNRFEQMRNVFAYADTFDLLDIAFAADRRVNRKLDPFLRKRLQSWPKHSTVFSAFSPLRSFRRVRTMTDCDICAALFFRKDEADEISALCLLFQTGSVPPEYLDCLIPSFLNDFPDSESALNALIQQKDNYPHFSVSAVKILHSYFSQEQWASFLECFADVLSVDCDFLSGLPVKEQFRLLANLEEQKKAVDFLCGHMKKDLCDYPFLTAAALVRLNRKYCAAYVQNKMNKAAQLLPDADYLALYIENKNILPEDGLSAIPYSYDKFARYFSFSHSVYEKGDECLVTVMISDPADRKALALTLNGSLTRYSVQEDDHFGNYYGEQQIRYSEVSENPFVSAFLRDYLRAGGERLPAERDAVQSRIDRRKQEELAEQMRYSFADLTGMMYKKQIKLAADRRVSLEFSFFELPKYPDFVSMSLRISNGRGRFYLVKNFNSFLVNCRERNTAEYSKTFELTHILSNFDDNAQKVLPLLLHSDVKKISEWGDKRYAAFSGYVLDEMMRTLAGQRIFWESEEFTVRLRRVSYEISVDEHNVISVPADRENHRFYLSKDIMYDFNRAEKTVDIVDGPHDLLVFLRFAYQQNGRSLEPVLDTFKTDVYPRLAQYIRVPEEKMQEFRRGQLEINAYFDYSDRILSVRTDILKENVRLRANQITAPGDMAVYDSYQNYLRMLGFSSECPGGVPENHADAWLSNDAEVLSFFSMDFSELKRYCNVFLSDSIRSKMLMVFQPPVIRVKYESGIMQAFAESSEYSDSELESILKAIRLKKKYILLSGDRILRIDNTDSEDFADTVNDLMLDEATVTEPHQIPVCTSIRAFAHEANCRVDDYLVSMVKDISSFKVSKIPVPCLNGELRSYQEDGFRWLRILSDYNMGGILADDMGLGKTLEIITLLKSDSVSRPSLVVCPKSLVYNWKTEFDRFDPDTEVTEIYGNAAEREKIISGIDYTKKTVYITSYDSLRNDRDKYASDFHFLILDEAQYIKNINAQKSRTVKTLNAAHKLALTGTPIENNVLDLWSIFDFILPGYFENLKKFRHRFDTEEHFPETVSKRVAPFILRRTKKDVLKDLPEKYERILSAEMHPEQRKLYEAYKKVARDKIQSGEKAFDMLPILTRMRQICVDPAMFADNYCGGSGKIDLLAELIPEYLASGHRMLIFSQFVRGLEAVEALLDQMKIPYFILTGDTRSDERIRLVNEFNNSTDASIFLISLKAGGTGLNLTGADTVIHLDPWWNIAAENQATDRTHRIGQTKNVEVIKIICEDSVEQKVIDLQNRKKDLVDKLISNDESSVTGASAEDIAFILN